MNQKIELDCGKLLGFRLVTKEGQNLSAVARSKVGGKIGDKTGTKGGG